MEITTGGLPLRLWRILQHGAIVTLTALLVSHKVLLRPLPPPESCCGSCVDMVM